MESAMKNSALANLDMGLAFMAGSLIIEGQGKKLAAIGVSGAPSGLTDEACAQLGVDKVSEDLEMM